LGGYLTESAQHQTAAGKPIDAVWNSTAEEVSYVPRAHVQFLEQAGIRVVPISYLDSAETIESILDQVNGVYMPGDSQKSVANRKYQKTFSFVMKYVAKHNREYSDYFPMFLMGKSSQVFVQLLSVMKNRLHDMKNHQNQNLQINLLHEHEDTFLFHQLQNDSSVSHAFDLGDFFNKQNSGFRLKDIAQDERLRKMIQPLATFEGSAILDAPNSLVEGKKDAEQRQKANYKKEEEFVAIAEGTDLPLYIFTYNPEMTQFVHTEVEQRLEQDEVIDKSVAARHHVQFIAHQIADEGRLNEHKFRKESGPIHKHLIRNHEVVEVELPVEDMGDHHNLYPLPRGLEKHDVYIIKQKSRSQQAQAE